MNTTHSGIREKAGTSLTIELRFEILLLKVPSSIQTLAVLDLKTFIVIILVRNCGNVGVQRMEYYFILDCRDGGKDLRE